MAIKFIKKGKAAHQEIKKADAKDEVAKSQNVSRFYLKEDEERIITCLDGDLTDEGLLDLNSFYEHHFQMNGHWRNWFVCTAQEEPCPMCEGGDTPSLVSVLTIIDHTGYVAKDGTKKGVNERCLLVAKRPTIKMLQKIATKREGLTGCTFDVSRVGEGVANVGNMFEFVEKKPLAAIKKKYKVDGPFDYEEVIPYRSAKELRMLGFGSLSVGSEEGVEDDDNSFDSKEYETEL